MSSDSRAEPDPHGARAMQRAVDTLTQTMAEKMRAHVLGIPGPEPLRIDLRVDPPADSGCPEIAIDIAIPLGVRPESLGHVIAAATAIVRAAAEYAGGGLDVDVAEQPAGPAGPVVVP